jgi:hypothetical protein
MRYGTSAGSYHSALAAWSGAGLMHCMFLRAIGNSECVLQGESGGRLDGSQAFSAPFDTTQVRNMLAFAARNPGLLQSSQTAELALAVQTSRSGLAARA